jgi:hypothetical protein
MDIRTFLCRKGCDKTYRSCRARLDHELGGLHNANPAHLCPCGETFYIRKSLLRHRALVHGDADVIEWLVGVLWEFYV